MTDSSVTYNKHGDAVAFCGPDAVHLFRAASLVAGIGLLQKGIKPGRAWSMRRALLVAGQYTGKQYKRKQAAEAVADLRVWISTMKTALPSHIQE